jgi:NitT/TauT family transport system substrate-binding protein
MPFASRLRLLIAAAAMLVAGSVSATAEQTELRLARTRTMAFLPFMIMEHEKLLEKNAEKAGLPPLKVEWTTFASPSASIDALLTANVDVIAIGPTGLITVASRTKGAASEIKGVAAMSGMPMYLNTRNPNVKTLADFTDKDRIAMPAVKISFQATLLQIAAAKAFGKENAKKLDHIAVSLGQWDAVAAMLSPISEVTSDFCTPPFQYIELEQPGIHRVLSTHDILGTPGTIATAAAAAKFRAENPKLYKVFFDTLGETMDIIRNEKARAAEAYTVIASDKKTSPELLMKILNDPASEFTLTPKSMKQYADFMHETGTLKATIDSWKDLFFPEVHGLSGS